jgi:hypothetical protein
VEETAYVCLQKKCHHSNSFHSHNHLEEEELEQEQVLQGQEHRRDFGLEL